MVEYSAFEHHGTETRQIERNRRLLELGCPASVIQRVDAGNAKRVGLSLQEYRSKNHLSDPYNGEAEVRSNATASTSEKKTDSLEDQIQALKLW